ncbi:MAG: SDR family NAD(P)-dependent oxidoreductase [Magnetococcales bacterium]|nr:SDR family NAD(P)-dependent oxidoreductase [Magnetococcales bacterium]
MTDNRDGLLRLGDAFSCSEHPRQLHREPLAVIGLGCRFPGGATSPAAYWEMLAQGRDGVVEVPPERWSLRRFYDKDPAQPGKMAVRRGGFLQEPIDGFDPLFFGISPRDAQNMDPQQRLLLEVVWEAMEDAGQDMERLNGSPTGVYIGGFMLDFTATILSPLNRTLLNSSSAIGVNLAMLANRISHAFNFLGPSIAMDTACSSSLVSFHQACQAVWHGECSLAVTGGVNLIVRPEYSIALNKGQFLAQDGRCKSFDARGDGYGRGEGAGIVILKPLAAAQRDHDRIYALVHNTGANQDGHTNGITVPNADAQLALVQKVCSEVGIDPRRVRYVEAHGTGTALGDPTECKALGASYGAGRPVDQPCIIGSVKSSIGHLEAAAGVAGVIKAVLCLHHGQIPPQANLETLNPNIPFEELRLRVSRTLQPMPAGEGAAFVGVNSFGYGGTNAHALLSDAPVSQAAADVPSGEREFMFPLSARCEPGLNALARRWLDLVTAPNPPSLSRLARAASLRRTHLDKRRALIAGSTAALADKLREITAPGALPPPKRILSDEQARRPLFVLTGMGPQWWAMGRQLLAEEPVFRQAAEACDAGLQRIAGWSILTEMTRPEAESRITETRFAQPGNLVVQVGLVALWRSWGVEPAAFVGHSVGEVAAAYVSGALSLEDAIFVSYHRSRLQQTLVGAGTMLAVGLTPEECPEILADHAGKVVIGAINSPSSTNLSGDATALAAIAKQLEARGVFNRFLRVEIPYHSQVMDRIKEEFREVLRPIQPRVPITPLYSTVTGLQVRGAELGPDYWVRNIRDPVLFAAAMDQVIQDGFALFLEVGPHPVLATSIQECLRQHGAVGETLFSLNRSKPERATMLEALGRFYTAGYPIDWQRLHPPRAERHVQLPSYPWQRDTYWPETEAALDDRLYRVDHALLGQRLDTPHPAWESHLSTEALPYLNDHQVEHAVVFPGAGYVEIGLAMQRALAGEGPCLLENLQFHQAMMLGSGAVPTLHMAYDAKSRRFTAHTQRPDQPDHWSLHASGTIVAETAHDTPRLELATLRRLCPEAMDVAQVYAQLDATGLHYGPWFRGVRQLWRGADAVLLQIDAHPEWRAADHACRLHPTLLDACFQGLLVVMKAEEGLYLPVGIQRLRFYATPPTPFWGHIQVTARNARFIECDLTLCDDQGQVYVELEKLRCKAVPTSQSETDTLASNGWLYRPAWEKEELPAPATTESAGDNLPIVVLLDAGGMGQGVIQQLAAAGAGRLIQVTSGADFRQVAGDHFQLDRQQPAMLGQVLAAVGACRSVVSLWGLDAPAPGDDPVGSRRVADLLELIQTLVKEGERASRQPPRLFLVTRGAQPVLEGEKISSLDLAPLVGLARVCVSEQSNLRCTVLDIDPADPLSSLAFLAREVLADPADSEVAWRAGQRLVSRLLRVEAATLDEQVAARTAVVAAGSPFVLELGKPGSVTSLHLRACERRPPGPGEVEIEVHAAGIGRADLVRMTQMDLDPTPGKSFFGIGIGMEIAGVVVRTGADVSALTVGEAVLAIVPGGCRSHVTLPVDALWSLPRPACSGEVVGGVLPLAFLAAHHGLQRAALQAGERLLIHAAHSDIGLAAIQLAQSRGAELFVTADTPEKRHALQAMGLRHVLEGSPPTLTREILAATAGQGVDVILNALGEESGRQSLAALAPLGRFVEINTDPTRQDGSDGSWSLAGLQRNLTLIAVDLDGLLRQRQIMPRLLQELSGQLQAGTLQPIPAQVFPAQQAVAAFDQVQVNPLGKVVLEMRNVEATAILPERQESPLFQKEGTYLITGGFGSFGLELAAWMGRQGVKHLVLTGRQGAASAEAKQAVAKLEAAGTQVLAVAMDVTRADQVVGLIDTIGRTLPPLRGVVHAAAVLDDGLLMDLDRARMARVMEPKALGAWHLHQATRSLALDFFTLFSSVSSLIGNAGQGNYVAANAFLDALAHARRAEGLPATSINWGALGEVGMAARDKEVEQRLQRSGIHSIGLAQAMAAFARVVRWNPPQLGVVHMDWDAFAETNPLVTRIPRYSPLISAEKGRSAQAASELVQQLEGAPEALRLTLLVDHIRGLVAKVLSIPNVDRVLPNVQLFDLGINSLTAVELKNNLEAEVGISLGSSLVFNYPTIDALAGFLMTTLFAESSQTAGPGQGTPAAAVPKADHGVKELSEEEAEAQLLKELMQDIEQAVREPGAS